MITSTVLLDCFRCNDTLDRITFLDRLSTFRSTVLLDRLSNDIFNKQFLQTLHRLTFSLYNILHRISITFSL